MSNYRITKNPALSREVSQLKSTQTFIEMTLFTDRYAEFIRELEKDDPAQWAIDVLETARQER